VIGFAGQATLDSPKANTSTEVLSWGNNGIFINDGTFSSLSSAATVALASGWFFNSGPVNNFWKVTDGATTYTFDLTSSIIAATTATSITVALVGTVISNVAGLDATTFTGNLTLQDPASTSGGTFKYSESLSFGAVPDGGYTALLLGAGLAGLALLKHKFILRLP
jgi:hypothetical protein